MRHCAMILLFLISAGLVWAAPIGELRIATDKWPPYEDLGNTEAPGFSVEVIRHVMDQMGVSHTITEHPWPRALRSVYSGAADACFSAFHTDERAEKAIYPEEPLTTADYILFIRKADRPNLKFTSLGDLKGKSVGIVRDAAYPEEFISFITSHSRVDIVSTDELNLLKLIKKRFDYAVLNYANGIIFSKRMGLLGQVHPLTANPVKQDNVYLIFSRKTVSPGFAADFSAALGRFKASPEYHRIYKKYFDPWASVVFP